MQPPDESIRPIYQTKRHITDTNRPLILIGASIRAAAESAFRGGFDVLGIDRFGDRETLDCCRQFLRYPANDTSLDILKDQLRRFATNCPMSATGERAEPEYVIVGGLNDSEALIKELDRHAKPLGRKVFGKAACKQSPVDDHSELTRIAARAGVRFPKTGSRRAQINVQSDRESNGQSERWLTKDPQTAGGLGVRWLDKPTQVFDSTLVQQWIGGRAYGATFLCGVGQIELLGVCRSRFTRIGPCPFVYCGSFGPIRLPEPQMNCIARIGQSAAADANFSGLFNVDVIVDRDGKVWLLEINPRWSGSSEVVERAMRDQKQLDPYGGSLFRRMIHCIDQPNDQSIDGSQVEPTAQHNSLALASSLYYKRIVFARRPGRLDVGKLDTVCRDVAGAKLKDVPSADGQSIQSGEPIATLIIRFDESDSVAAKTKRLVAQVQQAVR